MLLAWKQAGAIAFAGYIVGLPGETPESVLHDIGSSRRSCRSICWSHTADAVAGVRGSPEAVRANVWMDPDLNAYDLETVTVEHPRMSREEWQHAYLDAWRWYYTDEHVERLMRRNTAYGIKTIKVLRSVLQVYGAPNFEGVHPQQCGYYRRKVRTERRPEFPGGPR